MGPSAARRGEYDAERSGAPSEEYEAFLDEQPAEHGLSSDDLTVWRPEKKTSGRAEKSVDA